MFGHLTKSFTAYHHGELSSEDRRRVELHVERCASCRAGLEEVRLTTQLLRDFVAAGPVEPAVTKRRYEQPASPFLKLLLAGMAAAIVIFSMFAWRQQLPLPTELRLGQWLETSSDVTLKVSDIGQIRLEGNTRLRLIEDQPEEHRIQMERGTMHATVWAPPRLFFVDTPSATAIDLGCAYTLKVDDQGGSVLTVTTGFVQLESKGRSSIVRAGWEAKTRKGSGPGTPYVVESSQQMRQALDVIDFESDAAAKAQSLDAILKESGENDLITLWHLLSRVDSSSRKRIYDRMVTLAAPPDGVTPEGVVDLNPEMMGLLKSQIGLDW